MKNNRRLLVQSRFPLQVRLQAHKGNLNRMGGRCSQDKVV